MFLTVMQQLQQFENISDQIAMPPEYSAALMWNLTLELYPFYGLPLDPVVAGKAKSSLEIIKEANAQIPLLQMPTALRGNNGGTYSIYGDFYIGSSP